MSAENLLAMSDDTTEVEVKFLAKPVPAVKLHLIKKDCEAASRVLSQLQSIISSKEKDKVTTTEVAENILI